MLDFTGYLAADILFLTDYIVTGNWEEEEKYNKRDISLLTVFV